jgi:hypothetical protein
MATGITTATPNSDPTDTPTPVVGVPSPTVRTPGAVESTSTRPPQPPKWTVWHTSSLLLIVVVTCVVGLILLPRDAFLASLGLMALFTTITGHGILGLWRGLLIDERNKLSLSRLQMVTWTIVLLSGFLTAALWNIKNRKTNAPLSIAIPSQLLLLMGISTTSLVASPLIRSTKMADPLNAGEIPRAAEKTKEEVRMRAALMRQNIPEESIETLGKIVGWKWPRDSRLADLFQGDEIGNAAHLDLGKVQMFFFTIVLVLTYAAALVLMFTDASSAITGLPPVDQGMVALLGISHAGFLANNATPHSVSG